MSAARALSRRTFLAAALAGGAGAGCAWRVRLDEPAQGSPAWRRGAGFLAARPGPFAYGVGAGDATSDGFVCVARCDAAEGAEVWLDLRDEDTGARRFERGLVGEGGAVYFDVRGVGPGRFVRYRLRLASGAASPVGWVRTAPAENALASVRFAATSCTRRAMGPFASLVRAAERGPLDFWVHAGDVAYCDTEGERARSLAEYRACFARHGVVDGLRVLRAAAGCYATWDDHEVQDNWTPSRVAPARVAAARRALLEHVPVRRAHASAFDDARLWRRFAWGRGLDVFLLDTRSERGPGRYVSEAQLAWLLDGLRGSRARCKLVVNPVPLAPLRGPLRLFEGDGWASAPAQRERVLATAAEVPGVVFLSGDFHVAAVGRAGALGTRDGRVRELLVGAAGSRANYVVAAALAPPQWEFATPEFGCMHLELDPVAGALVARYLGDDGGVRYRGALAL